MKNDNLSSGEKHALFLMSLANPDLYPNQTKIIPLELEDKNGKFKHEFNLIGLIGFISLAFHILQHEYNDVIKRESNNETKKTVLGNATRNDGTTQLKI